MDSSSSHTWSGTFEFSFTWDLPDFNMTILTSCDNESSIPESLDMDSIDACLMEILSGHDFLERIVILLINFNNSFANRGLDWDLNFWVLFISVSNKEQTIVSIIVHSGNFFEFSESFCLTRNKLSQISSAGCAYDSKDCAVIHTYYIHCDCILHFLGFGKNISKNIKIERELVNISILLLASAEYWFYLQPSPALQDPWRKKLQSSSFWGLGPPNFLPWNRGLPPPTLPPPRPPPW